MVDPETSQAKKRLDTGMIYLWYGLLVAVPGIGGLGLLVWQAYGYLQSGSWIGVSVIDVMVWSGVGGAWASEPTTWFGVWKLLSGAPASIAGVVIAVLMLWISTLVITD